MRYAIIDTIQKLVINIVDYDEQPPNPPPGFHEGIAAVRHDRADTAWTWDGSALVAPAAAPPSAEDVRAAAFRADVSRADLLMRLSTATPAQIDALVDGAGTLAKMQTLVKALLKTIALDSRS